MINLFRWIGRFEGISFLLLLFIAMPLKYIFHEPSLVTHVGRAHGGLFVLYLLIAVNVGSGLNWNGKVWLHCFLASCLPFGTFLFEKHHLPEGSKA